MADDGGRNLKPAMLRLQIPRLTFKDILFGGLVGIALLVVGWVVLVDDPMGGQPVGRVTLNETDSSTIGPGDTAFSPQAENDPMPESDGAVVEERDPRAPSGVLIIDASGRQGPVTIAGADPELTERGPHGPLPRVSEDGRMPATHYARPMQSLAADAPRIAIVLGGLGLSVSASEDAIRRLPGGVTMAFAPYGRDLPRITSNAMQDGHEIMLQVPLEPFDYPDNDPGPHTLLTGLPERQNLDRLHWVMSRFMGYTGISNYMGARFVTSERALEPLLKEVRDRGLLMLDDGSSPQSRLPSISDRLGLPSARADLVIDAVPRRAEIDSALAELEQLAMSRGYAVGSASALPVSVQALEAWSRDLEARGIVLVPLTAIVFRGST